VLPETPPHWKPQLLYLTGDPIPPETPTAIPHRRPNPTGNPNCYLTGDPIPPETPTATSPETHTFSTEIPRILYEKPTKIF